VASAAAGRHVPASPRLVATVGAVAIAYHFSLQTLASNWRYETPLADLVLVPVVAPLLLVAASRRHRYVAFLRLGRLDFLVGGLLLLAAIACLTIGPALWSKYFWAMRLDLLTMPLFAAAGIVLLFGSRALVPFGFPLAFLLLAWPLPYLALLEHALEAFTALTAGAVEHVNELLRIATPIAGSDSSRYLVDHDGRQFVVSVASACSGVNSLVGFVIIGAGALWFLRGRAWRRIAWLVFGGLLVWALNVGRILLVLFTAQRLGQHVAFDVLHPVAGVLTLNVAFLLALVALPLFKVRRRWPDDEDVGVIDTPLARSALPGERATAWRLAPRLLVLVTAAAVLALADSQLESAASGFDSTGRPAVAAFVDRPLAGSGWNVRPLQRIGWATPYYGPHSSWVRYRLRPAERLARRGPFTVWADAILSPDLRALDAYSLAHCYSFHGFKVETSTRIDLGNGVVGQLFVYRTASSRWHALAWQWPVLRRGKVEHERIVLLANSMTRPAPRRQSSSGSVTSKALALLDARIKDSDSNAALSGALRRLASDMIAARIGHKVQT
jgi:exosortase/archaeosortase family protein